MERQPPMDGRQMRKHQIRPRFLDLAEFDDDLPQDASSRRAALESFSNWPPAATVVRSKAPTIASAGKRGHTVAAPTPQIEVKAVPTAAKEVNDKRDPALDADALNTGAKQAAQAEPIPPNHSKSVRFSAQATSDRHETSFHQPTQKATIDLSGSIIGTIQERAVGGRQARFASSARSKPSVSRFVVRRRMDEDLQKHEEQRQARLQSGTVSHEQEPGTGFPVVSHRDQIAPILPPASGKAQAAQYSEDIGSVEAPQKDTLATKSALSAQEKARGANAITDEEEWLDEDGRPMSAFRKSRLLRQGRRPPLVRRKNVSTSGPSANESELPSFHPDPTRDPGGGADIDAITSVLSEVSRENDQKIRQMSATEVSEEVRSLESLFGKDILDALRNRKSRFVPESSDPNPTRSAATAAQTKSGAKSFIDSSHVEADDEGPIAIKRQYFPAEPEGPNPSLEWMMPQRSVQQASADLRFDFSGAVMQRGVQTDQTYLSGLHHHGDDQESPGYTFAELLHLSRSTVAAQRQLALNVLGRICTQHPAFAEADEERLSKAVNLLNENSLLLRARVISIARWMLGDRHFTVRSAALRCLVNAIRSLPAGIFLPLGATQEADFGALFPTPKGELENHNDSADASEVEISIRKDWASVMLESRLVDLVLNKTDSLITSTWEAEYVLELLLRISSRSAAHARQVFEVDPLRLSDFITHLGLKVAWPPVPSDGTPIARPSSMPSITAIRLLHQGILSDRKLAESIVVSGSIEHLLRFVLTPPWKVEKDWATDDEEGDAIRVTAYQIYDEVLQLFTSLASYGFFASVVARTWSYWQESAAWAVAQLGGGEISTPPAPMRTWLDEAKGTAVQRIFELLAAWTHCAMDPHELMTVHDLTWTQVRDWIEPVMDAAPELASRTAPGNASAFGALSYYIDAWVRCAIGKQPGLLAKFLNSCRMVLRRCEDPVKQRFVQVLRLFSSAPTQSAALDEAEDACRACHRFLDASKTLAQADQSRSKQQGSEAAQAVESDKAMVAEGLSLISCGSLWQALRDVKSRASGRIVYQQTFSNFVAASMRADSALELAAITRLDFQHGSRVAGIVLLAAETLGGPKVASTLRPFLLECVLGSNCLPGATQSDAVERRDSTPLSQIQCLFRSADGETAAAKTEAVPAEAADDDESEVDPITGNRLWRCPASGLPMRADWPLLALDDLLHSANTGVLNRRDNLEGDWKPSELEIVRATLELSVAVLTQSLKSSAETESACAKAAMLCSLPSPEQILLGVMKVFMLEKDQPDTFDSSTVDGSSRQKPAGMLTGRDLFRDSSISSHLTLLLDVADELVELRRKHREEMDVSSVTLDAWTQSTYGVGMSFYQFFTDLVGLWDSVSFGDVNFARVVMTVANAGCSGGLFEGQHGVAVDFRRLVWNDYSDSLRSMPRIKVPSWLLSWRDEDVDMLEHYCRYLAGASETSVARDSIAWQIAAHHVGAALLSLMHEEQGEEAKTQNASTDRVASILKSLAATRGPKMLREILQPFVPSTAPSDQDVERLITRLSP